MSAGHGTDAAGEPGGAPLTFSPLAFSEHGDPGAPTIVLLHAFPLASRIFRRLVPLLTAWHVLAVDLPGLGASEVPEVEPSMDEVAARVLATMDAADVEAATLLGVSTGGYAALAVAALAPARVRALVLGSTSTGVGAPDDPAQRREVAGRLRATGTIEPVTDSVDEALGATARTEQPELVTEVAEMIAGTSPRGAAWMADAIASRPPRADTLRGFDGAVLILFGEEDVATPPDRELPAMLEARRGHERTRAARLPRTGHLTVLEQPVMVAGELGWVRDQVAGPVRRG
ncbi:alpha/beta fold hydrolase [Litorihabitans aurantiacus]|uniref:Alpha/beta hydrolase n=1 Tax=Litorihabitans aurantiacus TaxID=1930061 RepID=A0AA38CT70_9MICO|nr:alpha/beta hydrolase [Litorihabitans aurantiacus]GMA31512.1 alpha/beta hydrolase [Litorihabitans aurantiacus]